MQAVVHSFFVFTRPYLEKLQYIVIFYFHHTTPQTFLSIYSESLVNPAKLVAITTLLRVKYLPVEAETADAGSVSVANLCLCIQDVTGKFSYFFRHKIACTLLKLYRDFDAHPSSAAVTSAMQRLNRPSPAACESTGFVIVHHCNLIKCQRIYLFL